MNGAGPPRLTPGGPGWSSSAASGAFTMDANWLPFDPHPSRPVFVPPPGAVDAHCHVFGPGASFPYAPERKYTPCDASKEQLWALRDYLGFERNVIVQATCHGADNRALVDALRASQGRARGVATLKAEVSDGELRELDEAGVRGVRFNFVRRLVDTTPREVLVQIARRIAALGWHIVIYFEAEELPELYDFFASLPTTVVVDHMGRPDVTKSVDGPEFGLFMRLLHECPNIWSKVTCPDRLSRTGPPGYEDVVPFARKMVETFPDRVLWGTDWPHPNLRQHMPDDGRLVDFIPKIAATPNLQRGLLVGNPLRLYWSQK
jgi:2-pyrone-4,6-dicarboxylate lactonase